MYSKEDIEKKRQEALQRQRQKGLPNISANSTSVSSENAKTNCSNQNAMPQSGRISFQNFSNNDWSKKKFPNSSIKTGNHSQNKAPSSYKQQAISNRHNPIANNKFYGNRPSCEVTCSMISISRFAAETSIFHERVIEMYKTIPTRLYGE